MRIGIITFHRAFNVGAVLQAYALQTALRKLGHEVSFPDCNRIGDDPLPPFRCEERGWRRLLLKIRYLMAKIRTKYPQHVQRKLFRTFVARHLNPTRCEPEEMGDLFDTVVFGSDQIWNASLLQYDWHPKGGIGLFYGETVDDRVRRIAYGASIGDKPLSLVQFDKLRSAVSNFMALSVRESSSGAGLRDASGREPVVVCDPTMLLAVEDFAPVMPNRRMRKGKYILVYALHETPFVKRCAELVQTRYRLPVIVLPMYYNWRTDFLWKAHFGFGPGDFLAYFRDAECVLASSFHGTVFSILFGKPFVSICNQKDESESRPAALLRELGQTERLVTPEADPETWLMLLDKRPDEAVFDRVERLRSGSVQWLRENLAGPYLGRGANCCGCTACATVCSQNAIRMLPDRRGFLRPEVDGTKCVHCGQCERACSFSRGCSMSIARPEVVAYGARHRDMGEVMKSRSGAVFAAVSDLILEDGGVVYGAALKPDFTVEHRRAVTRGERDAFRGSKYIQSDMRGVFCQVKDDLECGRTVLFSGTPCQTAAIAGVLADRLKEKLLLVDIVCHGVASPVEWRARLLAEEMRREDTIVDVDFRNKGQFGWEAHHETCRFNLDRQRTVELFPSFYQTAVLRDSCYACRYCSLQRPSDLTIGDFWGWQKVLPAMNADDRGLNLVLVNSSKGAAILKRAALQLDLRQVDVRSVLQPNLVRPTPRPV